jgi:putative glutamine amidotransferase
MNKICLTWNAQFGNFKDYLPDLKVIKKVEDIKDYDLVIFPGGEDVTPSIYGKKDYACSETNLARDKFEILCYDYAMEKEKKILGICRGHQFINAVFNQGGLSQDINKDGFGYHPYNHNLEWEKKSKLFEFFGNKEIVSTHHQGVTSTGLTVITYYNGIIEAATGKNILTLQFHPEFQSGNESFFSFLSNWE